MTWIFEDNQPASIADRDLLVDYLSVKLIEAEGHFKEALQDDEGLAWRYPAFAVRRFSSHPTLVEKLRLLCQCRGTNENDVERNYQNQLVEFHALYALTALMGYQFMGWDMPSGKPTADPGKNCDLALMKEGEEVFADAKDCSSEILTKYQVEHEIAGEIKCVTHYTPKVELVGWLAGLINGAGKKGADVIVCHVPAWGLEGFDSRRLREYLNSILPGVLMWSEQGPRWRVASSSVTQVVIVKRMGCLTIQLDAEEGASRILSAARLY